MKIVFLLIVLISCGLSEALNNIVKSRTLFTAVMGKRLAERYMPYGCFCGSKDRGNPMDETDRCCWKQDCCYKAVKKIGCDYRVTNYTYVYEHGFISCGPGTICNNILCHCDTDVIHCLLEHRKTYNVKYHRKFTSYHCNGRSPKCHF